LNSFTPLKIYVNADLLKFFIINDNFNKAGVYRWVNTLNDHSYVGSSINLANRFLLYYSVAFLILYNTRLINQALIEYGFANFNLEILEYCDPKDVLSREQFFLDYFKPELNILTVAGKLNGFKHSDEQIAKRVKSFKLNKLLNNIDPPIIKPVDENLRANNPRSKAVFQYKADKSTLVAKFNSLRHAQDITGLSRDYIARCIKNDKISHDNFWFSFTEL
jgi:hypothetical protein